MKKGFERSIVSEVLKRLAHPPNLIQVIIGPRQIGKTTAARAVAKYWNGPVHFASADAPLPPGPEWIEAQWLLARRNTASGTVLLILDEVQKVKGWSETVKALWDQDRAENKPIKVIILGSSALLLAKGTTESLAGRFFLHRCLHWSLAECQKAFKWDLDHWIFFGGYPGAVDLVADEDAWRSYLNDSLIETVLSRDVLSLQHITKPILLRHLFAFAAHFPAQIVSYNKMLGQLQEAGNTTTLAAYLRLLHNAFLLSGLEKFSAGHARSRGSSPKLIFWNNALIGAAGSLSFEQARSDTAMWGRLVENAVGAHCINHLQDIRFETCYWRERNSEVDFVVRSPERIWALEVKSGRPGKTHGLTAFLGRYPKAKPLIIGSGGLDLEEFFLSDPKEFLLSIK